MSWLPILLLAAGAFAVAAFAARLPRSGWALFGAALLFGLAGYALHGNPAQPGSPKAASAAPTRTGEGMIAARRLLFDPTQPPASYVTVADGYARQGRFGDAATILRGALRDNPEDAEAWVALGNALVEHAEGVPTAAVFHAYGRADEARPDHPAALYFAGVALLRSQKFDEARQAWAQMIDRAPADAAWLPAMRERLAQLDQMLALLAARSAPPSPPPQ